MPDSSTVKKLLDQISKRGVNYEYFFEHATKPEWLEPLLEEGMFKYPPPPLQQGRFISFVAWPESRYLARMAPLAPEIVMRVVMEIPDTDNVRVHDDLCESALGVCSSHPELAARWANKEATWIRSQRHLYTLLTDKLGDLAVRLARSGEVDAALLLARALLEIPPDQLEEEGIDNGSGAASVARSQTRLDIWEYQRILKENLPDLAEASGDRALVLLCDLLEESIRVGRYRSQTDVSDDISSIWRPAIEDSEQNSSSGVPDLLVSAIRDISQSLPKNDTHREVVLGIIEERPFKVFKRIGLYLRRLWPSVDTQGTAAIMVSPPVFEDIHMHHEYFGLVRDRFGSMPSAVQEAYLDLVDQGIGDSGKMDLMDPARRNPMSEDEVEGLVRHWQYRRLLPIDQHLDEEWRQRLDALREEFGEVDHPDFLSYMSSWVGPTSPKSIDALRLMSTQELVGFLATWQPPDDWMGPSVEGLARELTRLVASEPERFSSNAREFQGLNPAYLDAILSGCREGIKNGLTIKWQPVLGLCRWITEQPQETLESSNGADTHKGEWTWTKKAVARLLSIGFEPGVAKMPLMLRHPAWEVLRPLTDDPDPTPDDEDVYSASYMDPATFSINTTRGEAMHAVIRYAIWLLHQKNGDERRDGQPLGFDEMPEVREVLELHLDPSSDASSAIRAVYGWWFPWILQLDTAWAVRNVQNIFPETGDDPRLLTAAWNSYITLCRPYDNVLDTLCEEYRRAIDRIDALVGSNKQFDSHGPDARLAEHLMIFYWRGKLSLDDEGGLLALFYERAHDQLRAHALDFIGRLLREMEGVVSPEILERLRSLWTRRMAVALNPESTLSWMTEISAFTGWFASGRFDSNWALTELKKVLELVESLDVERPEVERLATLTDSLPETVLECLNLIIEKDKREWGIHIYREQVGTILSSALRNQDKRVRDTAEAIINNLGARGYLAFRDLLSVDVP